VSHSLTWPAIIAGCSVDGAARQWLLTLLEGFKWVWHPLLPPFLHSSTTRRFLPLSRPRRSLVDRLDDTIIRVGLSGFHRRIKGTARADPHDRSQCCFDIETASRIIQEVWRRVDAGEQRADWKPVCDDFGLQVL
jgi:hypothetical protein